MTEVVRVGAVEAGGTKFVCLLGSSPDDIVARTRIPTGDDPARTLAAVVDFFAAHPAPAAVGIASFGPVELRPDHPQYGHITSTPKPGWRDVDLVGPIRSALRVPVGFDTDVAGAALGEGRWGAAQGLGTFVYMTVGTGIGAAAVVGGRLAVGLGHAEMGHISVPRQPGDTYPGGCPYHGDCLEGMAAGGAIAARFGRPAEQLDGADLEQAVEWEAGYLAAGLRTIVYTLVPGARGDRRERAAAARAVPAGAVDAARRRWPATGRCPSTRRTTSWSPAGLGGLAGPAGALVLAENALRRRAWLTVHARSALGSRGHRRRPARRAGRRRARGRRRRAAVVACRGRRLRHRGADDGRRSGRWPPSRARGRPAFGERPAAALPGDERARLAAYVDGLRAEGCAVDVATVRRGHVLQMLLYPAVSSLPFELLDAEPTPASLAISRERATAARFVLDLVEATR